MGIVIACFVAVFVLIGSVGLLLFYRQALLQRASSVIHPESQGANLLSTMQSKGATIGGVVSQFDRIIPKSEAEASVVGQRLVRAGYRQESAIKIFYGAKVLTPIALCLLAMATGITSAFPFFAYVISLGLGFILPDFWLGRRIKKRQNEIRRGLPDVLDLLVICIEAGLSVDQSTKRTAEELHLSYPALSDELEMVVLEQRAGRPRADAWKQLADRTDVDTVRNLVSVLVQSEKLGTSVAKTLRVHADTLRIQRRQQVEEQAAKTTIKLVFPLVLFIFPSLFVVTLGPEAILIGESFAKYFNH